MHKVCRLFLMALAVPALLSCSKTPQEQKVPDRPEKTTSTGFIYVQGRSLMKPDKTAFEMKGVDLDGWLCPDGELFGFTEIRAERDVNLMLCQIAGPKKTASFWKRHKDSFVTKEDISFIAECGANTVRVPLDWRLFSDDADFMGLASDQDGFSRLDDLFSWCRESGLYVILDMRATPGGHSGDWSDNDGGYPWLFGGKARQTEFTRIWSSVAGRYKDEECLVGYEIMDSPLCFEEDCEELLPKVEPLCRKCVKAIRAVDKKHVIILDAVLGGYDFSCFSDYEFDDNILYSGHAVDPTAFDSVLDAAVHFREYETGLPVLLLGTATGADGHTSEMCRKMTNSNVGYTFAAYKGYGTSGSLLSVSSVEGWNVVTRFADSKRVTFDDLHALGKFNVKDVAAALEAFTSACRFRNCQRNTEAVSSMSGSSDK